MTPSRVILVALVLCSLAASGLGAVIYDIDLYNATGHSIRLVDEKTGAAWASIEAGHSKKFAYYGGVTLQQSAQRLYFRRVDPPRNYISPGIFSVSFKAQLDPDLKIYLLPPSSRNPVSHIPSQPKGFPLSPVTRKI
jgi:hypothetical protein